MDRDPPARPARSARARLFLPSLLVVCGLGLGTAHAGPPYTTDDPEPVEYRHWEFYLASQGGYDAERTLSFTAPHVEVNYGAVPELQLHVITPLQYARPPGGAPAYGYGDTELGLKYRFLREGRLLPQVGVFPLVEVPTGDSARGLGAGKTQVFLPVWIQKSRDRWLSYGGGGYWINPGPGNRNWWLVGWHLELRLGPVSPGFEVYHGSSTHDGMPGQTRLHLGAVADVTPEHHLLVSVGRRLGAGRPAFQWYVAYQLTVGPQGRPGRR